MSNAWLVLDVAPGACGHCVRRGKTPVEVEADSADGAIAAFAALNGFARTDGGWASEDGRVWIIMARPKEDDEDY